MAVTADQVITRAARTLNDLAHERWTEAELLEYLSDAQWAAVQQRPDVNPVTRTFTCVEGAKQNLADDDYVLINVTRNDGGDVISHVDRKALDQVNPGWIAATSVAATDHFVYDTAERRHFYLSPPVTAGTEIEIVTAKMPPAITAAASNIRLQDIYVPALVAYILHRAFLKDIAAEGQSVEKSTACYTQFLAAIHGLRAAIELIKAERSGGPEGTE